MSSDLVIPIADPGLGNTSYLVDLGDGRGLAVDATRESLAYLVSRGLGRGRAR